MEALSTKKPKSVRRRRLEIRRPRSVDVSNGYCPTKRGKRDEGEKEDDSGVTTDVSPPYGSAFSTSTSSRSPPSDSDGPAIGILAAGARVHGNDLRGFPCVSHGSVSVIGRRREMEDTVTVAPGFVEAGARRYDFFGVYDGHGGAKVAQACRDRLHLVLAAEVGSRGPSDAGWKEAMEACFMKVDGEVMGRAEVGSASDRTVGSTAVVAVVGTGRIVVANCGDSRAVLSRGGVAVPLSSDHKPDRADEMERVEAAGGRVINWDGHRVLGVLATSRSIGDHYLKPYVTSEPEVTVTNRTNKDEFLILASDGLWDVVSNEVACVVARRCLAGRTARLFPEVVNGRGGAAEAAAALLAELAMSRGSRDNISVVVVELRRMIRCSSHHS